VTELVPFRGFFPAEPYHQDYYSNHPFDPYSLVYITPKFDVFRKMMMKGKSAVRVGVRPGVTPAKRPQRASETKEAAETVATDQNRRVPEGRGDGHTGDGADKEESRRGGPSAP
jgi:hypothetical protein